MQKFFAILCLGLLFGCVSSNPQNPPQQVGQNGLDNNSYQSPAVQDINGVITVGDVNSIVVDLDFNRVFFNFEIDLNSSDLDLNVLATSCDSACNVIDANSWRLSKDLNFGLFYCTCTKTICYDRKETRTQIINYCRDDKLVLTFDANKPQNNQ